MGEAWGAPQGPAQELGSSGAGEPGSDSGRGHRSHSWSCGAGSCPGLGWPRTCLLEPLLPCPQLQVPVPGEGAQQGTRAYREGYPVPHTRGSAGLCTLDRIWQVLQLILQGA